MKVHFFLSRTITGKSLMKSIRRFSNISIVVLSLMMTSSSLAQTTSEVNNRSTAFAKQFWDYLKRVQYRNWAPPPNTSADFTTGHSPHGAFIRLYVNRTAYSDMDHLAYESILVQENYDDDKKLQNVTVLYRSRDSAPDHNDWYWIQYNDDGSVATTEVNSERMPLSGKIQSCIECHQKAAGDDFVYSNDSLIDATAP